MPRISLSKRSKKRALAIAVVSLLIVLLIGWQRIRPRFRMPQELQHTAVETSFREKLSELTANQGWFQTDATMRRLCDVPVVARNDFKQVAEQLVPDLDFYWVKLRTYHLLRLVDISAPYRDLVVAVDRRSGEVWSFHSGVIQSEIVPFAKRYGISIQSERDAVGFSNLFYSLCPGSVGEVDAHVTNGQSQWVVVPRNAAHTPLCINVDHVGGISSVSYLNSEVNPR